MVWYSLLFKSFPQFVMIHTVKDVGVVEETDVDVFLEFLSFLYDPVDVGNLVSGSSSFSKPHLDVWRFLIQKILKANMQYFKHDLASMGNECNVQWLAHSLVLHFSGIGMKIDLFQPCGHCWVFQIC